MRKLTFLELASKILREENKPMTPVEIWACAQKKGYDAEVASRGKTPWLTISALIYVDIRDNKESRFVKIDSDPTKFFLKELASEEVLRKIEEEEKVQIERPIETGYSELDLHGFLTYFAYTYMNIYTKTIKHQLSLKANFAQWLHPDLVGVYLPINDWQDEVIDLAREAGAELVRLYSFEMKKEINFSTLRESFFQTVSNSSWANAGYLVAATISEDAEFLSELKRLSTSFGIGIVKINVDDPNSSEVLFPAEYKSEVDWGTINKLGKQNPDFRNFLKRVKADLSILEVRKEEYDEVLDADKLREMIKK